MKKLFRVKIEDEVYVMAENESEAIEITKQKLDEEVSGEHFCAYPNEVKTPNAYVAPYISEDWEDSIPYGEDNKTCGEIIQEMMEAEEKRADKEEADKKQLKFDFYKDIKTEEKI